MFMSSQQCLKRTLPWKFSRIVKVDFLHFEETLLLLNFSKAAGCCFENFPLSTFHDLFWNAANGSVANSNSLTAKIQLGKNFKINKILICYCERSLIFQFKKMQLVKNWQILKNTKWYNEIVKVGNTDLHDLLQKSYPSSEQLNVHFIHQLANSLVHNGHHIRYSH